MIIRDLYLNAARRFPNKMGIISGDKRYTFKEVKERVNRISNALFAMGLKKGDRVAILDSNKSWYLKLYFGITAGGMIAVPLNYRLAPREYVYLLNQSGTSAIFVGDAYVDTINSIRGELPNLKHFINYSSAPNYIAYEKMLADSKADNPVAPLDESDIATIGYTSGTTAQPKGALITHKNFMANNANYLIELPLYPTDVCYNHFPMFHCGGYSLTGYYGRGLTQVYDDFALKTSFEVIQKEKVNYWYIPAGALAFVPTFPDHAKYDVRSLRVIYTGGSSTRNEVVSGLYKMFPNLGSIHDIYGLTECTASVVARTITKDMLPRLSEIGEHCGPEVYGVHVRLVDDSGKDVPVGELGEVAVKGDTTCKGYWDKPKETAESLKDGWLHTGDIGKFDENRNLYIVDRKKDMILSGGENIASKEVEATLFLHPAVLDCAVIGLPDPKWGENVHAVVVLKSGMSVTQDELIDFCKANIASYKKPKSVDFVKELPRNPSGKVLKKELRLQYKT